MRFFQGTRTDGGGTRKQGLASQIYKQNLLNKDKKQLPPATKDEQYRQMLDAKITDVMNEVAAGRKKAFQLPGTKTEEKKEMSKNFKALMQQLGAKKLQADLKKKKQKEKAEYLKQKAAKKAADNAKRTEQAKIDLAKKQAEYGSTYFFGTQENDKKWWW